MNRKWMWVPLLALGLTACQSLPRGNDVPPPAVAVTAQAMADEAERIGQVEAVTVWGFAGRVAVSNGRDGGNGRLDWDSDGAGFRARLSAPVTRQGWELQMDPVSGQARLDGLPDGPRSGPDGRALVQQATGWDLPLAQLGQWVRGLVDGAQSVQRDAAGLPLLVQHQGWEVRFGQWYPASATQPALPRRIDAVNGQARVRLLVDQWSGWEP